MNDDTHTQAMAAWVMLEPKPKNTIAQLGSLTVSERTAVLMDMQHAFIAGFAAGRENEHNQTA